MYKVYAECDSKCDTIPSEFQFLSCKRRAALAGKGRFIEVELRPVSGMDDRSSSRGRKLDLKDSVKVGPNGDGQRHDSGFMDQMRNWDTASSQGLDRRALLLYVLYILYGATHGR